MFAVALKRVVAASSPARKPSTGDVIKVEDVYSLENRYKTHLRRLNIHKETTEFPRSLISSDCLSANTIHCATVPLTSRPVPSCPFVVVPATRQEPRKFVLFCPGIVQDRESVATISAISACRCRDHLRILITN